MPKAKSYQDYLREAKEASDELDVYLDIFDKTETEIDDIKKSPSAPHLRETLENKKMFMEFIENRIHFFYIKMLTRMEQYRIAKELMNND